MQFVNTPSLAASKNDGLILTSGDGVEGEFKTGCGKNFRFTSQVLPERHVEGVAAVTDETFKIGNVLNDSAGPEQREFSRPLDDVGNPPLGNYDVREARRGHDLLPVELLTIQEWVVTAHRAVAEHRR